MPNESCLESDVMKQLLFPFAVRGHGRRLSFFLAAEEWAAMAMPGDEWFFSWVVEPTVICGRNQDIAREVDLGYCREHGIDVVRRRSGGGCVYADMSNIMFSYITKDEAVGFTFNRYINMVVLVLRKMGVDAKASGRNDVMIGDRKVSGNAFYHVSKRGQTGTGRSIVHGTMLYDTNMENMVGAITPSDQKLLSKGIQSVRQRIALLKDYLDIDIEQFKTFVRQNLCDSEMTLTDHDVELIKEIEKEYLTDDFIYGKNPRYAVVKRGHIDNVGDIEVRLEMKNNIIKSAAMVGDFFIVGDIDENLLKPIRGVALTEGELTKALPEKLDEVVMNLKRESFVELLLS